MHEVRQKVMNRQRNGVLTNKVVKNIIYWMKKYYMYIYKDTALARYLVNMVICVLFHPHFYIKIICLTT